MKKILCFVFFRVLSCSAWSDDAEVMGSGLGVKDRRGIPRCIPGCLLVMGKNKQQHKRVEERDCVVATDDSTVRNVRESA